jgi:hypothetical protein
MPVRANTHACPWARALRARVCCICVRGPCLGRPVSALGHPFGHLAPAGPLTPPAACWLLSVRDELFECQAVNSQLRVSLAVSRPFSSWNRSILTEIYLCHACSCQEILRTKTAGQALSGKRKLKQAAVQLMAAHTTIVSRPAGAPPHDDSQSHEHGATEPPESAGAGAAAAAAELAQRGLRSACEELSLSASKTAA